MLRTHPNGLSLVPGFFPMHSNRKRTGTQLTRPTQLIRLGTCVSCATGDSVDCLNLLPKGSCSVLIVHVVKDTGGWYMYVDGSTLYMRFSQDSNLGLLNAGQMPTGAEDGNIRRHSLILRLDLLVVSFTLHGEC